jgi:hypothetical protein
MEYFGTFKTSSTGINIYKYVITNYKFNGWVQCKLIKINDNTIESDEIHNARYCRKKGLLKFNKLTCPKIDL